MPEQFCPVLAGSTLALPHSFGGRDVRSSGPPCWSAHLVALSRQGFAAVDVVDSWLAVGDLAGNELEGLTEAIGKAGLRPVGLSVIRRSVIDPVQGSANLDYTHRALEAAARLSAPVVSIGFHAPLTEAQGRHPFWSVPGPEPRRDEASRSLALARVGELAQHARSLGLEVSLELYEDTLLGSGAAAAAFVVDCGAPNLGINADLANLYRQPRDLPETWQQTLQACLPHMNYWHVKNFVRAYLSGVDHWVSFPTPLEDGDIDYRAAFGSAAEAGYAGPVSIEHYGGDAMAQQEKALVYLRRLLEEM